MASGNTDQYEALLSALERERLDHTKTRQQLMDTQDRLEFALGEVEILKKQLEREKRQFEETFAIMKKRAVQETCRNVELESKCDEINSKNKKSNASLEKEAKKMQALADELANQKLDMKQKQEELRVAQMQEAYLMQLVNGNSASR